MVIMDQLVKKNIYGMLPVRYENDPYLTIVPKRIIVKMLIYTRANFK